MRLLLFIGSFFFASAHAQQEHCYDPTTDPIVNSFLKPNLVREGEEKYVPHPNLKEDESVIKQIHEKIRQAYLKYDMDPRLFYARMIGESRANPFVHALNGDGGYGLFQFTGGIAGIPTVKQACGTKERPANKPQRLCQVDYYIDQYVRVFAERAESGCMPGKKFAAYPLITKYDYLGFGGGCAKNNVAANTAHEKGLCFGNQNYQWTGACKLLKQVFGWHSLRENRDSAKVPLCESYINPPPAAPSVTVPATLPSQRSAPVNP